MVRFSNLFISQINKGSRGYLNASAFGTTKQFLDFEALPAVKKELTGFKKNLHKYKPNIFLNEQFNLNTLKESLTHKESILHIASHFLFDGLTDETSFLLLGNGETG